MLLVYLYYSLLYTQHRNRAILQGYKPLHPGQFFQLCFKLEAEELAAQQGAVWMHAEHAGSF